LDESKVIAWVQVVLAVPDSAPSRHKLDASAAQGLAGAHAVLVSQATPHNVRDDFGVAVRVCSESSSRLHEVIVHDTQYTEIRTLWVIVLGKAEVKP